MRNEKRSRLGIARSWAVKGGLAPTLGILISVNVIDLPEVTEARQLLAANKLCVLVASPSAISLPSPKPTERYRLHRPPFQQGPAVHQLNQVHDSRTSSERPGPTVLPPERSMMYALAKCLLSPSR
jgi:hypothetical protein